ncbi:unnamed protein product [Auanema sp. JU1783]|nr:unnamed protein product [Auanema sp. JU1783]
MEVGRRIECSSRKGTVRYVGTVEGHGGEWLGIEWDDLDGGKHDGCVNGKRYFVTKHPRNGSFIRGSAVVIGCNFLEGVHKRYVANNAEEQETETLSSKVVELVGMNQTAERQKKIFNLTTIVLDSRNICEPPPCGTERFQYCRDLNLYNNLLHKWEDVKEILAYFPVLEELVLRRNRMDEMSDDEISEWPVTDRLKNLILSECGISMETMSNVLHCFKNVTELHALKNSLTSVSLPDPIAERLEQLDLEGNPLNRFTNLHGNFKNLKKLSLRDCGLLNLDIVQSKSSFPLLEILNLKGNNFCSWDVITELQALPSLTILYIDTENFSCIRDIEVHEVIIAKLPILLDLNRFDVCQVERRSAEIRFLTKYFILPEDQLIPHKNDLNRLVKKYGAPAVEGPRRCLDVVPLCISYNEQTIERKLPLTITIHRLISIVSRQFLLDPLTVSMELVREDYIIALDNPMRVLGFYSPEANDVLRLTTVE